MSKKKRKVIRVIVLIIALLAPVIMYINYYEINAYELDYDLGEYLKVNKLSIIEKQEFSRYNEKYVVVNFETEELFGISLLIKGLNSKYYVLDTYYSDYTIKSAEYEIKGDTYNVYFSKNNLRKENPKSTPTEQANLYRKITSNAAVALLFMVLVSFGICFLVIISSVGKYRISDSNPRYDDQFKNWPFT